MVAASDAKTKINCKRTLEQLQVFGVSATEDVVYKARALLDDSAERCAEGRETE